MRKWTHFLGESFDLPLGYEHLLVGRYDPSGVVATGTSHLRIAGSTAGREHSLPMGIGHQVQHREADDLRRHKYITRVGE